MENIIKVLAEESDILFAFLFGSYAKSTQNDKSDIDIAVYLKDENIRLIEEIRSQGYESFSKSFRDIQAAKHALQESIEACLDVGSHIIAEKGFRRAEDYKDIYKVLEEEGIIDPVLSTKLQEMAIGEIFHHV